MQKGTEEKNKAPGLKGKSTLYMSLGGILVAVSAL